MAAAGRARSALEETANIVVLSGGSNGRVRRRGEALRKIRDGDVPTRKASRPVGRAPLGQTLARSIDARGENSSRSIGDGFSRKKGRRLRQLIRDPERVIQKAQLLQLKSTSDAVRNSPDPRRKISCIDDSPTRRLAECAIFSRERARVRIFSNRRSHEEGGATEEKALTQAHNEGIRRRTRTRTQLQRSCTMSSM